MYNLTDSTQGILIDFPNLFIGVIYLSRCHIFTTLRKCITTSCVNIIFLYMLCCDDMSHPYSCARAGPPPPPLTLKR